MSLNIANHHDTRREDWGTPYTLFATLSRAHDFVIDLCASDENYLCDLWISEQVDLMSPRAEELVRKAAQAFDVESGHGYAWINPPYQGNGGTGLFIARAAELCIAHGLGLVALVPASVGSRWWRDSVDPFFDFVLFTPRLRFEGAPATAQFDTAVCVMRSPSERGIGPDLFHGSIGAAYQRIEVSL